MTLRTQLEPLLVLPEQRAAPPVPVPATRQHRPHRYAAIVRFVDVAVVLAVVVAGIASGPGAGDVAGHARAFAGRVAGLLELLALSAFRAVEPRVLGVGRSEYERVLRAFAAADIALALGGLALHLGSVRIWVFAFVPLACLLCVLARQGLRLLLHRERRAGRHLRDVVVVGAVEGVAELVRRTRRDPGFGWRVVAACTPTGTGTDGGPHVAGVPVAGDLDSAAAATAAYGARVVAVAPAPGWGPGRLQQLAWDLEGSGVDLAVDPGLTEIAGPRLHITPVDGMPLLRLTSPRFGGAARVVKDVVDRVGAALLLVVAAPVFLVVAVAVRLDGGPAFSRQERVGRDGSTFRIVTFRSMVADDLRVTRVGAFLRAYSIDELPQLLNVLTGAMSLVGPRPPLGHEVVGYGPDARRKLRVKPGMTGLWQVSGRGDLTWEESVRLDLRYVENWSIALDLTILWRTAGALVKGRGAY